MGLIAHVWLPHFWQCAHVMATAYFHGRLLEYFSYQHDSPWLQPNETQVMITGMVLSVVGLKMKSLLCYKNLTILLTYLPLQGF